MENSRSHESNEWLQPPLSREQEVSSAPRRRTPRGTALRAVLLLAVGLVAGGAVALVLGHRSQTANAATGGSASSDVPRIALPGDSSDQAGNGAPGALRRGFGGGIDGEQRLHGTLTAIGASTIAVRSTSGTATYHVTAGTVIVRNGAQATLAELKVGDPVFVHVYPSSGTLLVERIFAGTLPGIGNGASDGGWRVGSSDRGRADSDQTGESSA